LRIDFLDANGNFVANIMDAMPLIEDTISFNVSTYAAGNYFVKFQIDDQIETILFMKK
jgi:hypothetical protein